LEEFPGEIQVAVRIAKKDKIMDSQALARLPRFLFPARLEIILRYIQTSRFSGCQIYDGNLVALPDVSGNCPPTTDNVVIRMRRKNYNIHNGAVDFFAVLR
jgi:hypothetical protein